MSKAFLEKNEGLYSRTRKFAFTNITNEDFTTMFGGEPIVIKPGETVKLDHKQASKFTDEMIDKIMTGAMKQNEVEYYAKNPNTQPNMYRAPSNLGVPAARKVWQDKICVELPEEKNSLQTQMERLKFREELTSDMSKEKSTGPVAIPSANLSAGASMPEVFAELKK